jgi:hypothetical protein
MKEKGEKDRFRKGFHLGRIIWFRDEDTEGALSRTRELLLFCNTSPDSVWTMSPLQFVNLITGGMDRVSMEGFGVLLIHGLEDLSSNQAVAFLRAIKLFRAFQYGVGMRLILVSKREVPFEVHRIHEHLPLVIDTGAGESDPGELDSRVHSLVEIASRVAETPIRRLSERAAHFLEETVTTADGEEILLLLVEGVRRSKGSVLRLRDILPNFSHYFGSEDEPERYCN